MLQISHSPSSGALAKVHEEHDQETHDSTELLSFFFASMALRTPVTRVAAAVVVVLCSMFLTLLATSLVTVVAVRGD